MLFANRVGIGSNFKPIIQYLAGVWNLRLQMLNKGLNPCDSGLDLRICRRVGLHIGFISGRSL